jgi:hypothetical protein
MSAPGTAARSKGTRRFPVPLVGTLLTRYGLKDTIGEDGMFETVHDVVNAYRTRGSA